MRKVFLFPSMSMSYCTVRLVPFLLGCLILQACTAFDHSAAGTSESSDGSDLIAEYVARDAAGLRLRFEPWFLDVVIWIDEPGWDRFAVIDGYALESLHADSSTARTKVRFRRIGHIESRGGGKANFISDVHHEEIVFTSALTDNGWRIVAPQIEPHVAVDTVLLRSFLSDDDLTVLRDVVRIP